MSDLIPVLDLFSGVGAYSLGLERAGRFKTVAFCEIDKYARRVLKRHWPHVPIYEDVEALTGSRLRADGIVPEWIVAGWPCQDISVAGTGCGLDGARSGLFNHIERLASEIRPRGLLLENSTNLLGINGGRDFGEVLRAMAALGYDVVWHCLPAAAFDAPHIRDRLWIVCVDANADGTGLEERRGPESIRAQQRAAECVGKDDANAARVGCDGQRTGDATHDKRGAQVAGARALVSNADRLAQIGPAIARAKRHTWEPEPDVGRVASGIANRVDRIRTLGNLNPPIIPETIARAILEAMA